MNLKAGYFIRRVLLLIPLLVGLSILTFSISRVVPGDPVGLAAGPQATPEIKAALRKEFGLDQSLPVQYYKYVSGLFKGDWGQSLYSRRDVADDLRAFFPATLELTLAAVFIAAVLGTILGVFAALYQNRIPDHLSRIIVLFFVSFPQFWLAMIFQLIFGLMLDWFPISKRLDVLTPPPERITGMYTVDSLLRGDLETFGASVKHLFIPALVLSFGALASITRITRANMLEALDKDFVKMERAVGLPEKLVIGKYVLRTVFIATLTVISLEFGWLMAGAVLVETIFDWPGLGLYIVESSLRLDFQPIMGITIIYGIVFSTVNIVTDLLYGLLDPRIRYE
ncbi:MAG: peptide ABC transporter [Acidiferrobacteraceae bacterium]|nr:peptide ABC transporter [Acidiferrobacteraceae bacterium]|tara:strand:- start:2993 stop:4009 length:1017 start_codon:yes stop_codon:yes gene_type:complete